MDIPGHLNLVPDMIKSYLPNESVMRPRLVQDDFLDWSKMIFC
jgi:hypothetical protein